MYQYKDLIKWMQVQVGKLNSIVKNVVKVIKLFHLLALEKYKIKMEYIHKGHVKQGKYQAFNRDLLQELDTLDRNTESNVDIGATNTGISYITAYQGDLSSSQPDEVLMAGGSGGTLYVANNRLNGTVSDKR